MGLFGGFRAKFTKNSKSREKPENVVILKYHSFSEFDSPHSPEPSLVNNSRKTDVIRQSSKYQRPIINSTISNNITRGENLYDKQKSLSLNNLDTEVNSTPRQELNNLSETRSTGIPPKSHLNENLRPSKSLSKLLQPYSAASSSSKSTKSEWIQAINSQVTAENRYEFPQQISVVDLEPFDEYRLPLTDDEDEEIYADPSTLVSMTRQKSEIKTDIDIKEMDCESPKTYEVDDDEFKVNIVEHNTTRSNSLSEDEISYEEITSPPLLNDVLLSSDEHRISLPEDENKEIYSDSSTLIFMTGRTSVTKNDAEMHYERPKTEELDDDEFKVNIVQHNRSCSVSEDEISYQEDATTSYTSMGFSSQAASIFFGEDIQPVINRRRRILVEDDDDDDDDEDTGRRGSADC